MICAISRRGEKLGFLSEQKIGENQRIVIFLFRKKVKEDQLDAVSMLRSIHAASSAFMC